MKVKLMMLKVLSGMQLPLAGDHCSPCTSSPSDGALHCARRGVMSRARTETQGGVCAAGQGKRRLHSVT